MSSYDPEQNKNMSGVNIWNGVITGAEAYIFRFNIQQQTRGVMDLENFLLLLNDRAKLDNIQNIFIVPYAVLGNEPASGQTSLLTPHTASYEILPRSIYYK